MRVVVGSQGKAIEISRILTDCSRFILESNLDPVKKTVFETVLCSLRDSIAIENSLFMMIPLPIANMLLAMVGTQIKNCIDDPRMGGKTPEYLSIIESALRTALDCIDDPEMDKKMTEYLLTLQSTLRTVFE
jgi:hypothetical protein